MFCVAHESAGGGIPLLADGWQALASLPEPDQQFLKTRSVSFPPPNHINYAPYHGPIAAEADCKFQIRFRYDLLDQPEPPVRRYFDAVKRQLIQLKVFPGSIFVLDNHRLLHGRTELKAGLTSDRHFKRLYAETI